MKKVISLCMLCILTALHALAQSGVLKVTVVDSRNHAIANALVTVTAANNTTYGSQPTDRYGIAIIKNLQAGKYNVLVSKGGYKNATAKATVEQRIPALVKLTLWWDDKKLREPVEDAEISPQLSDRQQKAAGAVKEQIAYEQVVIASEAKTYNRRRDKTVMKYVPASPMSMPPTYYNPSTESYKKEKENDFMSVRVNPLSTMSVDVDRASYSNIRRFINEGQTPPADAVRIEEMINYFDYDYPQPEGDQPLAIVTELTDCPWKPQHKLLHIGMQARTIPTHNLPPSNLVFLIDVSGSMSAYNKLPLVISSLKMLTSKLRAQDKISIVVYAGSAGLVLPATAGNQKQTIYNALDRLQAGGSTAGGAGIKLAYSVAMENYVRGGNNRVILATDGDFNVGISGDNELETLITKEREKGIYLTCLGYGMGNYKDSKMEVLADKGNGNYAYIDSEQEAEKTLVKEFGGTIFTLAKDVKAQIEFNPAYVQSYRLVGYENRLLNEEDFKDDKKDAGDMGSGHSVTIIYEIIPAGVQSNDVRNVTPLKYQQRGVAYPSVVDYNNGNELATIKFRYKKPNGNTSKEITHITPNHTTTLQRASENARFAASVAMFGMLLKNSPYKGNSNYNKVLSLARNSMRHDSEGYRAEYIDLVRKVNKTDDVLASNGWYEEED